MLVLQGLIANPNLTRCIVHHGKSALVVAKLNIIRFLNPD